MYTSNSILPLLANQAQNLAAEGHVSGKPQHVIHGLQLQPYQTSRTLSDGELNAVLAAKDRWLPQLVTSKGSPIISRLASPEKTGLLRGLAGTVLEGGAVGGLVAAAGSPVMGAVIAGLTGLLTFGAQWVRQTKSNEEIIDFLRLTNVPHPSIRVFEADFDNIANRVLGNNIMGQAVSTSNRGKKR
jgi:hypothetical protein